VSMVVPVIGAIVEPPVGIALGDEPDAEQLGRIDVAVEHGFDRRP